MMNHLNAPSVASDCYIHPRAVVAAGVACHRGCWIGPEAVIADGCVICPGAVIGLPKPGVQPGVTQLGTNVWVGPGAYIKSGVTVGEDCIIRAHTVINRGAHICKGVRVGARCTIMDNARVEEFANLCAGVYVCEYATLGPHCQVCPGVILINDRYFPAAVDVAGPQIGACAILGVKSVVWPGVRIGYHAMVASLSEAKDDVNDYVLVRGRPARPVCDVRQIRTKVQDKWIYPYPWMRHNMPNEDITRPAL